VGIDDFDVLDPELVQPRLLFLEFAPVRSRLCFETKVFSKQTMYRTFDYIDGAEREGPSRSHRTGQTPLHGEPERFATSLLPTGSASEVPLVPLLPTH
jgi:hypothetical protein